MSTMIIILIAVILIVFFMILFNMYNYVKEARELEREINNITEKDFNYYLPADFAAIKLKRGLFEAKITGVVISFEDDERVYEYKSNDYPGADETRSYIIIKDSLSPKVPDDWDFTKVKFVSLKYMLGEDKISRIITRNEVNTDKISPEFGNKCSSVLVSGVQKINCG